MAILSLLAKLGLDKTGFDAGMASASKTVAGFGADLKGRLGAAFGVGAMLALARETIAYGDSLKELGERLGVTSLEAQQFALASKLGGADAEFFATKFDKLKKAMSEAISGGKNPFAAFGLSVERLSQMKPSDVIRELADQMNAVGVSADKNKPLVDIFGKGASKMINILRDLENAKAGTIFFSDEDLKRLNRADDALTKLWHNTKVGAATAADFILRISKAMGLLFSGSNLKDIFPPATKSPKGIDESQILTDLEAADEERKVHMAIMDRVLALDREAAKLEADAHKAGLTDAQRKNELLKERVTLMDNLRTMVGDLPAAEEEARAMMRKRLAEVNLDLTRIDQQKPVAASRLFQIEHTKLGAIGGTLGNSGTRAEQTQIDTLRQIKEMREDLNRRGILVKAWR